MHPGPSRGRVALRAPDGNAAPRRPGPGPGGISTRDGAQPRGGRRPAAASGPRVVPATHAGAHHRRRLRRRLGLPQPLGADLRQERARDARRRRPLAVLLHRRTRHASPPRRRRRPVGLERRSPHRVHRQRRRHAALPHGQRGTGPDHGHRARRGSGRAARSHQCAVARRRQRVPRRIPHAARTAPGSLRRGRAHRRRWRSGTAHGRKPSAARLLHAAVAGSRTPGTRWRARTRAVRRCLADRAKRQARIARPAVQRTSRLVRLAGLPLAARHAPGRRKRMG